jgi:hypothetical protein
MRRTIVIGALAATFPLLAVSARAQSIAATSRGIVAAHHGIVQLFRSGSVVWTSEGPSTPARIVASEERIAVIDPLANRVRVLDLATGRGDTMHTGETPIDGVFIGSALYLLERDARALERIGADGTRASVSTGADPAFLRMANGRLYVYSRAPGIVQEIATTPFAERRSVRVAPFASDFAIDSKTGYLVDPRAGTITTFDLASMRPGETIETGAVPIAVAFASTGTSLTARTIAVADPSAKKVWLVEGAQSVGQAFTRGFLRGLIGLGLFGGGASQFPTGVDRLFLRGSKWYAFDSSSGTLYRFTRSASSVVATHAAASGIAVSADGVFVWNDAVRRLQQVD